MASSTKAERGPELAPDPINAVLAMAENAKAATSKRMCQRDRITGKLTAGARCMTRAAGRADQTRLKTREPLVPPKPKLFFSATSMRMSRATLAQ